MKRHQRNENDEHNDISPTFWVVLCILVALLGINAKCSAQQPAQLDTVLCKVECIQKFVTSTTKSGNVSYKAVYIDKEASVADVIPVSKSVYQYIQDCKSYGITPLLGIKLKNGEINAIIRLKYKYRRVRR